MPTYMNTVLGERPSGGIARCLYPDLQARYCEDASTPKAVGTTIADLEAELRLLSPPCLRVTSLRSGLAAVEVVKPGTRRKA